METATGNGRSAYNAQMTSLTQLVLNVQIRILYCLGIYTHRTAMKITEMRARSVNISERGMTEGQMSKWKEGP